jgi:hypothetical protein
VRWEGGRREADELCGVGVKECAGRAANGRAGRNTGLGKRGNRLAEEA